ncbi:MAG: hypothetical protein ACUVTD_02885 [Nitrososphaerales archaeon]
MILFILLPCLHAIDRITQKLRAESSPVKCFYKGCRNRALFYAEAPNSSECWYACSEQRMSYITTKGVPIPKGSYKSIKLVNTAEKPLSESYVKPRQER